MKSKTNVEGILCTVLSSGASRSLQFKKELLSSPRRKWGAILPSEWFRSEKLAKVNEISTLVALWLLGKPEMESFELCV